jgi:hypothetical protein
MTFSFYWMYGPVDHFDPFQLRSTPIRRDPENEITRPPMISSETVMMDMDPNTADLGQTLFQQGMCNMIICIAI